MHLITKQLAEKLPSENELLNYHVVDPLNIKNLEQALININHLTVYDATNTRDENLKKFSVKNHINNTGSNPIRKSKKNSNIQFLDITNIYQYNTNSVITNCCGNKLNNIYDYPSHYLCHITILAKKMKILSIQAFLINVQ